MTNLFVSFLSVFLFASAEAKEFSQLRVTVNYGEKVTTFVIPDSRKTKLVVNGRERKTLKGNIDTAFEQAAEISKLKSNEERLCRRRNIEMSFTPANQKQIRIYGCIDSQTPAALKLTELSNLLTLM